MTDEQNLGADDQHGEVPSPEVESDGSALVGDAGFEYDRKFRELEKAFVDYASDPSYVEQLQEAYQVYCNSELFGPGDLVQWKARMRSGLFPAYGYPAIVLEVLEPPLAGGDDDGTWYEPLNLVIGVVDPRGEFFQIAVNSRRLTRY